MVARDYMLTGSTAGSAFSQDCPLGYWGENCDRRCEIHCRSHGGCDRTFGACVWCDYGYWGSYCNHRCPENCYRYACRKMMDFAGFAMTTYISMAFAMFRAVKGGQTVGRVVPFRAIVTNVT